MSGTISRRRFMEGSALVALSAVVTSASVAARAAGAAAPTPLGIVPRSEWGGDLRPKGDIPAEDVRFLLVHHTQDPGSGYSQGQIPEILRSVYDFHTGSAKDWPDVAYNFFVDKFGGIWEGRTGSLAGAVAGSATGGNQGFSQLCSFLGDHSAVPPTDAARAAMVSLLAWLANRYSVATGPDTAVTFTSRGSNRYPKGKSITTNTIAGHRDMSQTECPGDACYKYVVGDFRTLVPQRRGHADVAATVTGNTAAAPATMAPSTATAAVSEPATAAAAAPTTAADPQALEPGAVAAPAIDPDHAAAGAAMPVAAVAGGTAVVAAATAGVASIVVWKRRRAEGGGFTHDLDTFADDGGDR